MTKQLLKFGLILVLIFCMSNVSAQNEIRKKWYATVYTTAQNTDLRISKTNALQFQKSSQPIEKDVWIFIDPYKKFQTIFGIGGAITDASAEIFAKLTQTQQNELLEAFYSPQKGIGYTFARTNIGSCDFSSDSYTYVTDKDKWLKTFNISHDKQYKIPLIKKAMTVAGGRLALFVSPWSPPAWMKDNNDRMHGGKLLPQYWQTWANYLIKFIHSYQSEGIPVWGLSVQNEPMAIQKWESCIYTAEEERDFIKKNLGPALVKAGLGSKKLIAWDHNRDLIYQRASVIMQDPEAAKYVWGFGYHWYETWSGSDMQYENLKRVKEAFPAKNILFTEGCIEKYDAAKINEWWLGERYGKAMINDFNNGSNGWIDWNILLDETGGPNHAGNFCYAPVHVNPNTGQLTYTNIFYYQGHFSKFVKPDAQRIACSTTRSQLLATAFINKDGNIALIVMNPTNDHLNYNLLIQDQSSIIDALPHSMSTIILKTTNTHEVFK
ncbi:MAG: glycoside hydrolase family 30 [Bacteroidetes bacterium]|nr:glycoside hydrolase family 30 [Bacteroidota bacterium]